MTRTTSTMASNSVLTTSRIESFTTVVVSNEIWYVMPGGNDRFEPLELRPRSCCMTSSALAVGSWMTPKPTASKPLKREVARVLLGAELRVADVPQPHQAAVRCRP